MRHKVTTGRFTAALVLIGTAILASCGSKNAPTEPSSGPTVLITAPAGGAAVSGIGFYVTGSVSAADSVALIRMSAGGVPFDSATSAAGVLSLAFSFYVPAALFPDDENLLITIEGYDLDGDRASKSVTVSPSKRTFRFIGLGGDQERSPAWSPDGLRIAYSSEGNGGNRDIYTMAIDGADTLRLTTDTNDDVTPAYSADGQQIAFASARSGNWDIWTIPVMGGEATRITENGADDRGPAWSPGGSAIAFQSVRDGNWNIYTVPVAGGYASGNPTAVTAASSAESSAVWTGEGDRLVFTSNDNGSWDISSVTPPDVTISPVSFANDPTATEVDPHWSRLGDYLLISDNRNGNFDIWVVHPPSGTKQVLTSHVASDREPVWSRDGKKIAFASNRNGTWDIWIVE